MKTGIRPTYYKNASIVCACGAKIEAGSTVESTQIELCSKCHPFYTGKQKIVDTARRVEKFKARAEQKSDTKADHKAKTEKKAIRAKKKADKKAKAEN